MNWNISVLVLLVSKCSFVVFSQKLVICYYGTWATYRQGLGKFNVEHINPALCSHVVYTFVGINNEGTVISLDSYLDLPDNWGRDNFGKFNSMKKQNHNLKTLLAGGGWNEGSAKYSIMAANPIFRQNFILNAIQMILDHGFDGFDLDWEYPNRRDTVYGQTDVDNFTQLIKELREAFDEHGLILTAAVASVKDMASLSYDVPAISKYLDAVGLMTYDMYGSWDPVTGHNSPLHKGEGDELADRNSVYSVDVAVEYWLSQGCPPEKLVIGLPFYGKTFTLTDPNNSGVRSPSSGPGIAGPYTQTQGTIGYNEFCALLESKSWVVHYDELAKVPYAVQNRNWVSYDDVDSLTKKVEYGLQKNVAGFMIWSIETDDFHGICGEDFPLLRAVNRAIERGVGGSGSNSTSTTTDITTTSTSILTSTDTLSTSSDASTSIPIISTTTIATISLPSTTNAGTTSVPTTERPVGTICNEEGLTANLEDCSKFYFCIRNVDGELSAIEANCPSGLYWDQEYLYCNYANEVECAV